MLTKLSMLVRAALVIFMLFVGGCKQGEGDVCQVNADCGDNLVCNQQSGVCQVVGGGNTFDAAVFLDAPDVDAPVDAPVDGPTIDAPVIIDAPTIDAPLIDAP